MSSKALLVLILAAFSSSAESSLLCDSLGVHLYDEIGCVPISSNSKCPELYMCEDFKQEPGYCVFGSRRFRSGEEMTSNGCFRCSCTTDSNHQGLITCLDAACLEPRVNETCINIPNTGCCKFKTICPSGEQKFCHVDGVNYKEGEKFTPNGTCWDCYCQEGFRGMYEEPYCKRRNCELMKHKPERITKCAPIYESNEEALCCPIDFVCPEDAIELNLQRPSLKGKKSCRWGDLNFEYKSEIKFRYRAGYDQILSKVTCSCKMPPYLTCFVEELF